MAKRSDIEAQIAVLQQELEGADDEDDFEIEIFADGKGARLPFRQGRSWLEKNLGLEFGSPASPAGDGGQDPGGQGGNGTGQGPAGGKKQQQQDPNGTGNPPAPRSYFGGGRK